MPKVCAGLLIAAVAAGGIYGIAATAATTMAAGFATPDTTRRAKIGEFAAEVKLAFAERRAARAKCALLADAQKKICIAEAMAEARRSDKSARQL